MAKYDFQNLLSTCLNDKVSLTGGEKISVESHIEQRIQAYKFKRGEKRRDVVD